MAWPPPTQPINTSNTDAQFNLHPTLHNDVNAAMNDTTDEITAINLAFDRGNQSSEETTVRTPTYVTLLDTGTGVPLGGGFERHVANLYRLTGGPTVGTVDLSASPGSWSKLAETAAYLALTGEDYHAFGKSNIAVTGAPIPWSAVYDYQTPTSAVAPDPGEAVHGDNQLNIIAVNKVDQAGADREYELSRLRTGDTIRLGSMLWTVNATPTDQTTYFNVQVLPTTQAAELIAPVYFTPAPIQVEYGLSFDSPPTAPSETDGSRALLTVNPAAPTLDVPIHTMHTLIQAPNIILPAQPALWARTLAPVPEGTTVEADLPRTTISAIQYADTALNA